MFGRLEDHAGHREHVSRVIHMSSDGRGKMVSARGDLGEGGAGSAAGENKCVIIQGRTRARGREERHRQRQGALSAIFPDSD